MHKLYTVAACCCAVTHGSFRIEVDEVIDQKYLYIHQTENLNTS